VNFCVPESCKFSADPFACAVTDSTAVPCTDLSAGSAGRAAVLPAASS
jgi:hypothetical protein